MFRVCSNFLLHLTYIICIAIRLIVRAFRKLVNIRKNQRVKHTKKQFFNEVLSIYKNKIQPKKPIFTTRRRSKKFGSGPYDLRNVYVRQRDDEPKKEILPHSKMVLYQSTRAPVVPLSKGIPEQPSTVTESEEDEYEEEEEEDEVDTLSDTSLPTHISEIEPTEALDIKEFVRTVRNKYRVLN